jgi:hypothetical protein
VHDAPIARPTSEPTPLTQLLSDVAATELDALGWDVLARRARSVTGDLAAAGQLPHHLVVALTDPPVVVARVLLVAARRSRLGTARSLAEPARCA